ncbi:MAG: Uma2 family endonuclease [Chloroflexota bacterium]|nr:Uma2 family endonuclease [Chloroflexota bacterium]
MATTVNRLTYDDLVELQDRPEYEHVRLEIIDGELFVSAAPVTFHQRVITNILYALEVVVRPRRLGIIFTAPVAVRLSMETTIEPDILYIGRDRRQIISTKVVEGAPDLVMEILSPDTRKRDLTVKKALYERSGVGEYWIIDPTKREVAIFSLIDGAYTAIPVNDAIARSIVIPEFAITLADLFDLPD